MYSHFLVNCSSAIRQQRWNGSIYQKQQNITWTSASQKRDYISRLGHSHQQLLTTFFKIRPPLLRVTPVFLLKQRMNSVIVDNRYKRSLNDNLFCRLDGPSGTNVADFETVKNGIHYRDFRWKVLRINSLLTISYIWPRSQEATLTR